MTDDMRRQIIEAVARGEMSPEDAAARLDEAERPEVEPAAPVATATGTVRAVRIESEFGSVRVYGDSSVAGAVADGPHRAEQEGETLVIRSEAADGTGFVFGRGRRVRINVGGRSGERVNIRMNPRLALELAVEAGDVRVEGVEGPIRGELQAGLVRIEGFREPIELAVQAGQVKARGRLDHGASHVRCEAGQVKLELERGSSVRVRARSSLGHVQLEDAEESSFMVGGGSREAVIGGGAATLDIEATLGQVKVRSER